MDSSMDDFINCVCARVRTSAHAREHVGVHMHVRIWVCIPFYMCTEARTGVGVFLYHSSTNCLKAGS